LFYVTTDQVTVRTRTGLCPLCGHEAAVRVGGSLSLHRTLGLPVRPARCGHRDSDDRRRGASQGDWPCVCDHAFHGD
jgi:hypothetical protein